MLLILIIARNEVGLNDADIFCEPGPHSLGAMVHNGCCMHAECAEIHREYGEHGTTTVLWACFYPTGMALARFNRALAGSRRGYLDNVGDVLFSPENALDGVYAVRRNTLGYGIVDSDGEIGRALWWRH